MPYAVPVPVPVPVPARAPFPLCSKAVRKAMLTALLATSCTNVSTFICAESTDCMDGSFSGTCQPNGYCSFDDDDCPSGQRYGDLAAGDLAGQCVELEGTTGAPATTSDDGGDTLVTLDGVSLEQGSLEASSLDDTTTMIADPSTSSGHAVDDTSTTDKTSMSGPDTDPMDGSTTDATDCLGMEPVDECTACVYEVCCEEVLACAGDDACLCFFQCNDGMTPPDLCTERCGMSMTLDGLNTCIAFNCMGCTPMQ